MSNTHSTADAFHRDGFCVIESLIPPSDLKQMQDETQCIIAKASQAAQSNDHFDFEPSHSLDNPRLRRIKRPNEISALFAEMVAHPVILDVVRSIIGDNIRLNHSKINIKGPAFGSALEWHQDWAFIPHTHHGLVIAAIALDDCTPENGSTNRQNRDLFYFTSMQLPMPGRFSMASTMKSSIAALSPVLHAINQGWTPYTCVCPTLLQRQAQFMLFKTPLRSVISPIIDPQYRAILGQETVREVRRDQWPKPDIEHRCAHRLVPFRLFVLRLQK